ncbi:MAG TPA: hypothetical protein VLA24_06115 [Pseudomonadales bacterium]|nr:hypothetical protein [Pseudomonadales bacterium]
MTNDDDMLIRQAARDICAAEAKRQGLWDNQVTNYRHVSPDIMAAALKVSKPDPLVEIFEAWFGNVQMEPFRAALNARGLQIVEKNDD